MQSIAQKRASDALQKIQNAAKDSKTRKSDLSSYANDFPAMILMNGLGQAAAFYRSKKDEHRRLYDFLSEWLCGDGQVYANHKDLLDGITKEDMHKYRLAQAEALAYLDWIKKFAKAFLDKDSSSEAA